MGKISGLFKKIKGYFSSGDLDIVRYMKELKDNYISTSHLREEPEVKASRLAEQYSRKSGRGGLGGILAFLPATGPNITLERARSLDDFDKRYNYERRK